MSKDIPSKVVLFTLSTTAYKILRELQKLSNLAFNDDVKKGQRPKKELLDAKFAKIPEEERKELLDSLEVKDVMKISSTRRDQIRNELSKRGIFRDKLPTGKTSGQTAKPPKPKQADKPPEPEILPEPEPEPEPLPKPQTSLEKEARDKKKADIEANIIKHREEQELDELADSMVNKAISESTAELETMKKKHNKKIMEADIELTRLNDAKKNAEDKAREEKIAAQDKTDMEEFLKHEYLRKLANTEAKRLAKLIRRQELIKESLLEALREAGIKKAIIEASSESKARDELLLGRVDLTLKLIQAHPELKQLERKIRITLEENKQVDENGLISYSGQTFTPEALQEIMKTIPNDYKDFLRPAIMGLGRDELDMNQVVAGLVGLAVSLAPGGSMVASLSSNLIRSIFNYYEIDLNNILSTPKEEKKQGGRETKHSALSATSDINVLNRPSTLSERLTDFLDPDTLRITVSGLDQEDEGTPWDPPKHPLLRGYHNLVEMARASGIRAPTLSEISRGGQIGGVASAVVGGLSSGSLMTGAGSIGAGMLGGAVAGALPLNVINERLTTALEGKIKEAGYPIDENRRRQIKNIITALPPAVIGAAIGYNPNNDPPMGYGIVSGAGVTESKLTVPQSVIDQTSAQLDQKDSKNKIWQPKAISPSTDILNESRQERYADDLEFIMFDYQPGNGAEGGYGDNSTNPLKYSQAKENSIRYDGAGVSVPYLLWNKVNDANEMTPQRIEKLAMGVQLPEMIFMDQDNDTTFENVADYQYANGENTAIEFLSPYSDFSLVQNYWMTNENNMLFTVNP